MNKVNFYLNFNSSLSKEIIKDLLDKEVKRIFSNNSNLSYISSKIELEDIGIGRVRVFEIPVLEVLNNLSNRKKSFVFNGHEYLVKMNSQRYFMFKENASCVCCGLKGTRMFLEYHPYDMTPHFNLYGEYEGDLVLMTKDHILAKAFGGEDKHSNYQTMCSICNSLKGHTFLTLESLKSLRSLYDFNKGRMTKKQIHCFLEEVKNKLSKKERKPKRIFAKNGAILNCDLACFLDKKGIIYGCHIYEKNKNKRIGCMKKGTSLTPILEYKGEVICSLNEFQSIRISKSNLVLN